MPRLESAATPPRLDTVAPSVAVFVPIETAVGSVSTGTDRIVCIPPALAEPVGVPEETEMAVFASAATLSVLPPVAPEAMSAVMKK